MHFPFLKNILRQPPKGQVSSLKVDVHTHLLPNIDDGAKDLDESLKIISELSQLGFQKLILTPHVMDRYYPNSIHKIQQRFNILKEAVILNQIPITLDIAAEYYLDEAFLRELMSTNELLYFSGAQNKKYLLFETAHVKLPVFFFEAIRIMIGKGFIPVLAHPEKYPYLHKNVKLLFEMHAKGVLFQVNITSFSGESPKDIREFAEYLSNTMLISFMGTDCHSPGNLPVLKESMQKQSFQTTLKKESLLNNSLINK